MRNKSFVSVVMPVFNTKDDFLRESIESILNQTYKNFEFIILNDGSDNNAKEVILSYKDERIIYVENELNLGIVETLNKGFDIAKGQYIARMDSDDISLPERFEKQLAFLESHPDISLISANTENFPINNAVKYPEKVDYLIILKGCWINHPLVMYRKADFEKYNLKYDINYQYAEDYELWSRAIRYLKFANLPDVLLRYRCHNSSLSHSKHRLQIRRTKKIRQNMLDYLVTDIDLQNKILLFSFDNLEILILFKLTQIRKFIYEFVKMLRRKGS